MPIFIIFRIGLVARKGEKMGSGNSGNYHGTRGCSQPFALFYRVMPDMRERDISRGVLLNGRYSKNPTAEDVRNMIHGNYVGDKNTNGLFIYAIDMNDNIIVGKRNGNGTNPSDAPTPHPTLLGGKNPRIQCAGMLDIRGGKIYSFENQSGHFKPNAKSLERAAEIFARLPKNVFHKKYIGGKSK